MADYTNVPNMQKRIDDLGRTYEHLQELADQQKWGDEPMIPGNMEKETEIPKYTQKTHYWLWLSIPRFDPATGNQLVPPKKVAYNIRTYEHLMSKNRLTGYDVKMIHDPSKERKAKQKTIFKPSTEPEQ